MGRKIFVSYKYSEDNVRQFDDVMYYQKKPDTVRSYVNILEEYFKKRSDHVYKGETDDNDLSHLSEASIQNNLFDRIYDSTMTIVMISCGMKGWKKQKDQWIPREISYSLREQSRTTNNGCKLKSGRNALLAVVIPDRNGSYDYLFKYCLLCPRRCLTLNTGSLFQILVENTNNLKTNYIKKCRFANNIYRAESSYVTYVGWDNFISDYEKYISIAYNIQEHEDDYNIHVQL